MIDNSSNEKDKLTGMVDSIVYRNDENGYTVCIIEDRDGLVELVKAMEQVMTW